MHVNVPTRDRKRVDMRLMDNSELVRKIWMFKTSDDALSYPLNVAANRIVLHHRQLCLGNKRKFASKTLFWLGTYRPGQGGLVEESKYQGDNSPSVKCRRA